MRPAGWLFLALMCGGVAASSEVPYARRTVDSLEPVPVQELPRTAARAGDARTLFTTAPTTTTLLYAANFDGGGACTAQGWTAVDQTAQIGDFFHVDDYAGLNPADFSPLDGTKSLWCGARPETTDPLCRYMTLPGYGNDWRQAFCTKNCFTVSGDGVLDVSFLARFDSEADYDATTLEYTTDCSGATGWTVIDGGIGVWDGDIAAGSFGGAYNIGTTGPVKVRFHFQSDGAWSDEDGLFNSNGAVHIDNLLVEGVLEDFEGDAVGATSTTHWESCTPPGFGLTADLVLGGSLLQEDPCVTDLSCVWAFIAGSTYNYACGGHPEQTAVPFPTGPDFEDNLDNRIVSPEIPLAGSGGKVVIEFDVYRDLPLDNLVFYNFGVRTIPASGCPGPWRQRSSVQFGDQKDWHRSVQSVGDLVDLVNGVSIQVSLVAFDRCWAWCGVFGTGVCHSHAPLFDNVKVYRVGTHGPQWSILDVDQFQDNFATDGTLTGTVRADMARSILAPNNPNILPGDSARVTVSDAVSGLDLDASGKAAVYCYVAVSPVQAGKTGAPLSGGARWPVVGSWTDAGGTVWTQLLCDTVRAQSGITILNAFCIDLNDDLFTPADTVCFFYGARSTDATESYAFGTALSLTTLDREEAASNPSEFTCLPTGGGDILYVDGMDGRGAQPAFDLAFAALGILDQVDRFDVRGPSSAVSNRPASRVKNVATQLNGPYRKILWDSGDLSVALGDGSRPPEKTNDYGMLNTFLDGLTEDGGVYLCGDDLADELNTHTGASAVTFRTTNLPFVLAATDHRPLYGVSPAGTSAGGVFTSDPTFVIQGGCPLLNDFDVLTPSGSSTMEVSYGAPAGTNGAVLSSVRVNGNGANVGVLLSGFSFAYIGDDDLDAVSDRADHLHDVITWLGNLVSPATGVQAPARTSLSQNYPNPFNPRTTIAFSVKERGRVRLSIYDVSGKLVRELVDENRDAGAHVQPWDGRDARGETVASGVYFYRLQTVDAAFSRKMILLK